MAHDIDFETTEVDLLDREAALNWIDANQLGRRNLKPQLYSLLRGRLYNRAKKRGFKGNQHSGSDQNDPKLDTTAERIASQHGVSEPTIKRDGRFAAAVAKVKKTVDPEIEAKVVAGKACRACSGHRWRAPPSLAITPTLPRS
jgi:hypothetical protein